MDRRKTLAATGAVSLTASAALVALGSSLGLFGLADSSPNVGKLSPIDATHQVSSSTTSTTSVTAPPAGAGVAGTDVAGHDVADDHGQDGAAHDVGGNDVSAGTGTTTSTTPQVDDHGDDTRGPGSADSGLDGSGTGHDDDD